VTADKAWRPHHPRHICRFASPHKADLATCGATNSTIGIGLDRRPVRATLGFFHDLDRQLPSERGPGGEPSTSDFQTFELLAIIEVFAARFDELPALITGRDDYRILVSTGVVVRAYRVVGQTVADGAVELISLDVDTDWT